MVSVCFYFQVHQPHRLRHYSVFDIGKSHDYFDHHKNRVVMEKVASKCYLPANNLMHHLIDKHDGRFRIAYSITGAAIQQFEQYQPDVIQSFQDLAKTGCVEFLSETFYHSLSYLFSKEEFTEQVLMHKRLVKRLFGQTPTVFRNTELVYNNELAKYVEDMGYKAILAEGADHILGWRSPNYLYRPVTTSKIKLLLKNYKLSDDIAFRFSNRGWEEWPLTVEKFAQWVNAFNGNGTNLNLFMDYETIGEHQWKDTGIFNFLRALPAELLKHPDNEFLTPSQVADKYEPVAELDIHTMISWADIERDLSAWLGNEMQQNAMKEVYAIERAIKETKDEALIEDWRRMQTSDHFYYMCTKWFSDGDVHRYFNPYDSPYDSFIAFMNIMNDLMLRIRAHGVEIEPPAGMTPAGSPGPRLPDPAGRPEGQQTLVAGAWNGPAKEPAHQVNRKG
ncbi:glycoside hydrolase family 57 protein [Candidatus Woesearchaeota archaeon]|nr:glycoside hydrolase family 57 protein [Candidatus Woesearchaeota archaeon]